MAQISKNPQFYSQKWPTKTAAKTWRFFVAFFGFFFLNFFVFFSLFLPPSCCFMTSWIPKTAHQMRLQAQKYTPKVFFTSGKQVPQQAKKQVWCIHNRLFLNGKEGEISYTPKRLPSACGGLFTQYWCIESDLLTKSDVVLLGGLSGENIVPKIC